MRSICLVDCFRQKYITDLFMFVKLGTVATHDVIGKHSRLYMNPV